jgi:1-acyl-sn-glycerol-3-phosphate acyltransferase
MSSNVAVDAPAPEYAGPHRWQIQAWARVVRRAMRWRAYTRWVERYCMELTVTGRDAFDAVDGPCIIVANHQSHMDTLVLFEALPERIKPHLYFGAAQDRWYVKGRKKLVLQPWYQSLVLGNFPIQRGGGSAALDHARWLLRRGPSRVHLSGGDPGHQRGLGEFRAGVALLALELRRAGRAGLSVRTEGNASQGPAGGETRPRRRGHSWSPSASHRAPASTRRRAPVGTA